MPRKEVNHSPDGGLSVDEKMLIERKLRILAKEQGHQGEDLELKVKHDLAKRIEQIKRENITNGFTGEKGARLDSRSSPTS